MKCSHIPDPFEDKRLEKGVQEIDDHNDPVTMVLRLKDVRKCAHNWKSFNSGGAVPGRIIVPSETEIRSVRQIPIEMDPPEHTDYRALVEPWFKRPLDPEYKARLTQIIEELVDEALIQDSVEGVEEFSLRLQSRALTLLLNVPYEEADTWISWGTHVFRSSGTDLDPEKASVLDRYIERALDQASENPGEDLYSVLLNSEVNGKKLTREEAHGVINLTFAGGRDTVINAITNSLAYFADHPESLERLRKEPEITGTAVEELIRYFTPLTHIGRISSEDTAVCEHAIKEDSRVSLCWASANRDASVFEDPNDIKLDRRINPHVGFGFGNHKCLGATHARQILRILYTILAEKVKSVEVMDHTDNIEYLDHFNRKVGFDSIQIKFNSL